MIKWLTKSTNEMRLETKQDVDLLEEKLREQAAANGYILSNFSWTEKEQKIDKDEYETYYHVKYTFTFGTMKNPEFACKSIDYNFATAEDVNEEGF